MPGKRTKLKSPSNPLPAPVSLGTLPVLTEHAQLEADVEAFASADSATLKAALPTINQLRARWRALDQPATIDQIATEVLRLTTVKPSAGNIDQGMLADTLCEDLAEMRPTTFALVRGCRAHRLDPKRRCRLHGGLSPRTCGARTRASTPCQRPAVRGRRRCRLHGGLSPGAPRGSKNGNFKNGDWTTDAIAERKWLRSLVQSFADNGATKMNELLNPPASIPDQNRLPPVRVELLKPDAYDEQTRPPASEEDTKEWEAHLNKALGTVSPDFVKASLLQLQGAARSPYGTISETAINAALAMIEAAAPRDELEAALAVQMACCHAAATAVIGKLQGALLGSERRIAVLGSTAARLMKAFAMQMEVRRRLRIGGQQYVRVEHVHVNDGGQAVIGNVKK